MGHHYLPIPEPVFHGGFYVSTVGRSTTPPHQPYPPGQHPSLYHFEWEDGRTLPEFGLLLITAGRGTFESRETGSVDLLPRTVAMTFPGVWHRYRPHPEVGWTERWMHFNGEMAHVLLDQEVISPGHAVRALSQPDDVAKALDGLLIRIQRAPMENSLLISLNALNVLTLSLEAPLPTVLKTADRGDQDPLVARALEYIWSWGHHMLSVQDVTVAVNVSRRTLERRTRLARGRGVLDEIIQCRFSRAERLLRETDLPITTVASLAGFGSDENLRHVFVTRTNLAPAHYRTRFHRRHIASCVGVSSRVGETPIPETARDVVLPINGARPKQAISGRGLSKA